MTEYKTVGEEGTVNNEVRYYRWVDFGGIKFLPSRIPIATATERACEFRYREL